MTPEQMTKLTTTVERPRMKGWIHAAMTPISVVMGVLLVIHAGSGDKWSTAIFSVTAVLLFGVSAVYHLGHWSARGTAILRRMDHANIFLIIAGSFTPLATMLLAPDTAKVLLWIVWVGAFAGVMMHMFWLHAPRWLYTPVYVGLGWVAVGYMGKFYETGGWTIVLLIAGGGLAYTVGALFYALKKPNLVPGWFGFHELFHVCTVIGYSCHFAAVWVATNLS